MTQLQKSGGMNPMAGTWTKAAKVRRVFKAGARRQKDRVLTPIAAIHEACILLDNLRNAMQAAKLSANDVQAALILVTPETPHMDFVYVLPIPQPEKLPELFAKVAKIEGKILPLGIAVRQIGREPNDLKDPKDPKSGAVVWVQPFLTGPRAERALLKARQVFADGKEAKSTFN
jgi:hypothetical protein